MIRVRLFAYLCACLFLPFSLLAQDLPDVAMGLQPYVGYHGGDMDNISTLTGSLNIRIPLVSYPQRGSLALSYSVVLNSFNYQNITDCITCPPGQPCSVGSGCTSQVGIVPSGFVNTAGTGPQLVMDQGLFAAGTRAADPTSYNYFTGRYYVVTSDEAEHPLGLTDDTFRSEDQSGYLFAPSTISLYPSGLGSNRHEYTGDAGFKLSGAAGVITDRHGIRYASGSPSTITDPDGNQISSTYQSTTDSIGRIIPAPAYASDTSLCPNLYASQFQPVVNEQVWTVPGTGGTVKFVFCYASVNISTNFYGLPPNSTVQREYKGTKTYLQSIILPNQTAWHFLYDSADPSNTSSHAYGELLKVIYPTGGSVSYTYTAGNEFCGNQRQNGLDGGVSIQLLNQAIATRTKTDPNGQTSTSTYSAGVTPSTVISPAGDATADTYEQDPYSTCSFRLSSEAVYQGSSTSSTPLRKTQTTYSYVSDSAAAPLGVVSAMPTKTTTALESGQASSEILTPDSGFPFVMTSCPSTGCSGPPANNGSSGLYVPLGVILNKAHTSFSGSIAKQEHTQLLWQSNSSYFSGNFLDLPASTSVLDGSGAVKSQTTFQYDDPSYSPGGARGHSTAAISWLNVGGAAPTTHTGWNTSGMKILTKDANGYTTQYQYNACNGSVLTDTYNALNQHTSGTYDCATGLLTSLTDPNNQKSTIVWDSMQRLQSITYPPIPAGTPMTTFSYNDPSNTVTRTTQASPDPAQTTQVVFDGFGREVKRIIYDSPQNDVIDTKYDTNGRVQSVSNPYRTTSDPTYGLTTFTYDALNRKTVEMKPDNAKLIWCFDGVSSSPGQTNCSGNLSSTAQATWEDLSDEAGHHSQHISDALGRLIAVMEPGPLTNTPSLQTTYAYDTLNNLTGVNQIGAAGDTPRTRGFMYDSLSRLLWSSNPETGVICYGIGNGTTSGCQANGYDANGNLLHKTDARSVRIDYSYDALNRLNRKGYTDGTWGVGFGYDGLGEDGATKVPNSANSIGRLSHISNEINAAVNYGYDATGRLIDQNQCIPSDCNYDTPVTALYDLAGNMTDLTYPDGRHIKQKWDGAGRLSTSDLVDIGGLSQTQSYLQPGSYFPDGSPNVLTLGNGVLQTIQKNNRLQVQSMVASTPFSPLNSQPFLSHTYCYVNCPNGGPVADNGNIGQITDSLNGGRTQSFTYDTLNRIKNFSLGGALNQQYAIDSFGNLSGVVSGSANTNFDPATNRITNLPCASSTQPYDAGGNQTCDSDSNNAVRVYGVDAESRISQIAMLNNTANPFETYTYGADGTRVRKSSPPAGTFTEYVDFNGQPIAEKDQTGTWTDYVYAGSQKIAKAGGPDTRTHIEGTVCASCGWQHTGFRTSGTVAGLVVQTGDKLVVSQFQAAGTRAGIGFTFTDGTYAAGLGLNDQDGGPSTADTASGHWHHRVIDLSSQAGKTVSMTYYVTDGETAAGAWSVDYRDFAYVRKDGTVTSLTGSGGASALTITSGETGVSGGLQSGSPYPGAVAPLHFYLADHLGTAQMEFGQGGWPVWQGQFAPFGGEIVNGAPLPPTMPDGSSTHYKFTGKERDAESGLDYFGARYYASSMGRYMSPDSFGGHYTDPQTLNKYSYVRNNPLRYTDPTGHDLQEDCKQTKDNHATCGGSGSQKHVGTTDAKGKFNITHFQTDSSGNLAGHDVSFNTNGVHIDGNNAEFISGTDPTRVNGQAGTGWDQTHFVVNSNCNESCAAGGAIFGSPQQLSNLVHSALVGPNKGLDGAGGHEGDQYRGGNKDGPDMHLSFIEGRAFDSMHFDGRYPYGSVGGFADHAWSWMHPEGHHEVPLPQDINPVPQP